MKPYTVQFVEQREILHMEVMRDAFKFEPTGRAQWLQRLAWRFLHWRGAMKQAYEPKVIYSRHVIDADDFIRRLLKQKSALMEGFHRQGQRLIIGSEDYFELMGQPSIRHHFTFAAEAGYRNKVLGLTVEVVPWMRGAVVMPAEQVQ